MNDVERLEEIKSWMVMLDDSADADDFQRFQDVLINLYKENDLRWLISTVEEQQKEIERLGARVNNLTFELAVERQNLRHNRKQNARLRNTIRKAINHFRQDEHPEGMATLEEALKE